MKNLDKIIFLDFDGVLNCIGTKDKVPHPFFPKEKIRGIDNFRVKLISDLALKTGAKIVISSTWRELYTLDELRSLLYSRGLDNNVEVIGITPMSYEEIGLGFQPKRGDRGEDITLWLNQNGNPETYLVIDDIRTNHDEHQVLTDDSTGFFKGHMKKALRILGCE